MPYVRASHSRGACDNMLILELPVGVRTWAVVTVVMQRVCAHGCVVVVVVVSLSLSLSVCVCVCMSWLWRRQHVGSERERYVEETYQRRRRGPLGV